MFVHYRAKPRRSPFCERTNVMRWSIWLALTLILMIASFGVGRQAFRTRELPNIAATLIGDESQFSRELDERIRERFPVGSNEDKLIGYLVGEDFVPQWRRRDDANASLFIRNGLLCTKIVRVLWRADATGLLTEIKGAYESHCL